MAAANRVIVLPEAVDDIAEAYDWYEERREGLGGEFLEQVNDCMESLQRHPEMCPFIHESYRRAVVRRFPYVILYEHSDDDVTVYAVFHASRDPERWRSRLS